ncbi:MAG: DUF1700 domain-containing protein [Candidatus Izemoplasmatales bacterium]
MKQQYLEQLRVLMTRYDIQSDELKDIINDYDQMYEDGLSRGLTHEEIYAFLGSPEKVVDDMKDSYSYVGVKVKRHNSKLIALMPFISVILFFILGMGFNLWHPGWLVFLLIPMVAILLESKTSLVSMLTALSPFIATITFFIIGYIWGIYHPSWLIFLIVPMIGALGGKNKLQAYGFIGVMLVSIALYLFLGYTYNEWNYSGFVFLLPIAYGVMTGEIRISFAHSKMGKKMALTVIAALVIFFTVGYFFNAWAWIWMIYLGIPVMAILLNVKDRNKIVALMPFISVIIFYSLGYFLSWWAFSWIAFLLIPVVAIIKNA